MYATQKGKGKNAWIDIQFNRLISISKVEIQQLSTGQFKTLRLSFSNGQSQTMSLSDTDRRWSTATINPPISSTSLRLDALELYSPQNADSWAYQIREIRLQGYESTGKYAILYQNVRTLSHLLS